MSSIKLQEKKQLLMTLFGKSKNENPELNETALKFTRPSPLIFFHLH